MQRATRAGDHDLALALSRAYDRLPGVVRSQMYPATRAYGAGAPPRGPVLPPAEPPLKQVRTRRKGRSRDFWIRVFIYGVAAPLAVAIGTYIGARHQEHALSGNVTPRAAIPTAATLDRTGRSVIVPTAAPTGANGLVTLLCQPAPGAAGYIMTAPRGAIVACTNGATPAVVS